MADMRQYAGGGPEARTEDDALLRVEYAIAQESRMTDPAKGPLESYPEYMQRRNQEIAARAREAKLGAYAARQAQDGPHSAMLGQASGTAPYSPLGITTRQRNVNGVGTDYDAGSLYASRPALNNPASTFTREAICAVIRAEKTRPQTESSLETLNRLQSIFENLE